MLTAINPQTRIKNQSSLFFGMGIAMLTLEEACAGKEALPLFPKGKIRG
jgi:hypothetical protein